MVRERGREWADREWADRVLWARGVRCILRGLIRVDRVVRRVDRAGGRALLRVVRDRDSVRGLDSVRGRAGLRDLVVLRV